MDIKRSPEEILKELTMEEKASLGSGLDFWKSKSVARLGVTSFTISDGPSGIRKQADEADHMGIHESLPEISFPSGSALGSAFSRELAFRLGEALGEEAAAEGIDVLLGPAINIKRSPLGGRNFEYFSEDPVHSGELAASYIQGLESSGVCSCLKHFAANNQETRRMSISAEIDLRTLREIYLKGFEIAVKKGRPSAVMSAYNRLNGVYASENHWLLTRVLREEWGFEGIVITDWGGMNDRAKSVEAGCDLEMPASGGETDKQVSDAVVAGRLSEQVLDESVLRILRLSEKMKKHSDESTYSREKHHQLAVDIAAESAVLLKNESVLPLVEESKILFIGPFAKNPRYQGGGSSKVVPYIVTNPLEEACKYIKVEYCRGYEDKDTGNPELVHEAVKKAAEADSIVIFCGIPEGIESEGKDRGGLRLPKNQNAIIEEIASNDCNVIVVLQTGSAVEMPWIHKVDAVLQTHLGGEGAGKALADILFGKVNPSGKLNETYPLKLEDNPSFLNFPGERNRVEYREGLYVGYRYYQAKKIKPLFCFGHGLSYTYFEYLSIDPGADTISSGEALKITVKIKNTGSVAGKEVVQLYVHALESSISRPEQELKDFRKIYLHPGEVDAIEFVIGSDAFSFFDPDLDKWVTESGKYEIRIGSSADDIRMKALVKIKSDFKRFFRADDTTTLDDLRTNIPDSEIYKKLTSMLPEIIDGDEMSNVMLNMPLHSLPPLSGGQLRLVDVKEIIAEINRSNYII